MVLHLAQPVVARAAEAPIHDRCTRARSMPNASATLRVAAAVGSVDPAPTATPITSATTPYVAASSPVSTK